MKILDALTGRTPEKDAEIEAGLTDYHKAQGRKNELLQEIEKQHMRLSDAKRELGDATYNGDSGACETLQKKINTLKAEIDSIDAAVEVANQKLADANRRLHLANSSAVLKTVRRLINKRSKHLTEMKDGIAVAVRAFKKTLDANDQIRNSWPAGSSPPDGLLTTPRELHHAVEREIARQDGTMPLDGPRFPGALRDLLAGDPAQFATIVDEGAQANARILELIEAGPQAPLPSIAELWPASEGATQMTAEALDPDDTLLNRPQGKQDVAYVNPQPTELVMQPAAKAFTIRHGTVQAGEPASDERLVS